VLRAVGGIRQFKIIQETLYRTRVLLATDPDFDENDVETIRVGLGRRLGSGVQVVIERGWDIPREGSGKYRYVVSHVEPGRSPKARAA
jgi:phenylacetate-CoA ligase